MGDESKKPKKMQSNSKEQKHMPVCMVIMNAKNQRRRQQKTKRAENAHRFGRQPLRNGERIVGHTRRIVGGDGDAHGLDASRVFGRFEI